MWIMLIIIWVVYESYYIMWLCDIMWYCIVWYCIRLDIITKSDDGLQRKKFGGIAHPNFKYKLLFII